MTRGLSLTALTVAAAIGLSACVQSQQATWYEDRCIRAGNTKGSAKYDACVSRDKEWVEKIQRTTNSTKAFRR